MLVQDIIYSNNINLMKKKITFCFDIDNTICKTLSKYNSSIPDKNAIKIINKLYEKGQALLKLIQHDIWAEIMIILLNQKRDIKKH